MTRKATAAVFAGVLGFILAGAAAPPAAAPAAAHSLRLGAPPAGTPLRLVLAPSGNEVNYRVREQLAHHDLPNDAIGRTSAVTGALVIGSDGQVIPGESRFVANVSGLKSDHDRRDRYVRERILQTDSFPNVTLVPTAIHGLRTPLPTSGARNFTLDGKLTVHGVTRPTTWQVKANFDGQSITGAASTGFTFDDFGLHQPHLSFLLNVADSIHLDYTFHLVPATGASTDAQPQR
ncbi:MAG TPA: YceI family protein [Gemmatimonadaceae bacterium]|nr:YceI family protein [Gemmatimonadaceae bacterium]